MVIVAILSLAGCVATADGESHSASESAGTEDTSTPDTAGEPCEFAGSWSASGLYFAACGAGSYSIGMAETTSNGWLGEDCLDGPAGPGHGDEIDVCHDALTAPGFSLRTVITPPEVVANETTLFTDTVAQAGHLAYLLLDNATGECWTQNDPLGFYDALGCE